MNTSIDEWLDELGLSKYASLFAEQEIDSSVLAELSEADLEKLGLPLGPRKKIMSAIAARTPTPGGERVPRTPRSVRAERRQLTVMFCDLVGSTALSQRLDPEDMREVLRAYQDACHEAVERYDGYVARYMGDGVLVYFGYPQAHEDEAERAIRAGLALIDSMPRIRTSATRQPGHELQVRVGVATGVVVAGDIIGTGAAQESTAVGETPNLAARLQGIAEPNTLVVSPATRALAGHQFEYADLGARRLKGIMEPVHASRVVAVASTESRFDARRGTRMTPLVGREHELALLLERWRLARDGEGQVVLLSGEPGIGKSRITQSLLEHIDEDQPVRLRYQCSPYHANSTLYPVIQHLERAAQFAEEDSAADKLAKLDCALADSLADAGTALPLLAELLSVRDVTSARTPGVTPDKEKEALLEALFSLLQGLSEKRTVLIVFEDIHWADPTSLELIELTIERLRSMRVLMVVTFRPDYSPPWRGAMHVMSLALSRFSRQAVMTMMANVTGGKSLPEPVREQILLKTDGVPLFVEEVTKTVLETGLVEEQPDGYALSGVLDSVSVPATLHDSLMMRLDRLSSVKEIAQLASVVGREFSYGLLAAVSPLTAQALDGGLQQLTDAELIFPLGEGTRSSYAFKHALVQDAAYESLLKHERQAIHQEIAQALVAIFPRIAEQQPELLAHHYTMARRNDEAIGYWQLAGRRAMQRSSYVEANHHLAKGLELLKSEPATDANLVTELHMQTALATALLPTKGYGATEVAQAFARAKVLCERLGDTEHLFPVMFGQWASGVHRDNLEDVLRLGEETCALAEQSADASAKLMGNRTLGNSLLFTGNLDKARARLEQALDLYDQERHRELMFRYGLDVRTASLSHLLVTHWLQGYPERAAAAGARAIAHGELIDHGNSLAHTLVHAGVLLEQLRNNPAGVSRHAGRLAALCEEGSFRMFLAWCRVLDGWAKFELGERQRGLELMEAGIEGGRGSGSDLYQPYFLALLAQCCAKLGQHDQGLRAVSEAMRFVEKRGERWFAAELHRVNGALLLAGRNDQEGARAEFARALEVARRLGARSLKLRSAVSLARLLDTQGRRDEARQIAAAAYDGFTEGFDTGDLSEARELMAALR